MKALLFILTASLITAIGIAVPSLWFLVFPGLALFLFLLQTRTERMSSAATYGLIYGTVTAGAATIWFWDTLPLSFLGSPIQPFKELLWE